MSRKRRIRTVIHTPTDVAGIRLAAQAAGRVLAAARKFICPGMSTLEADQRAVEEIRHEGGVSAFHNYRGFPGQMCISLNDEVVHGMGRPERIIQLGDIVSLECR